MAMTISDFFDRLGSSLKSLVKVTLQSRKSTISCVTGNREKLIVLGNGPSLNDTIANHAETLGKYPKLAVNFAANAPQFQELRPEFYVLADPHFFTATEDENVKKLLENINAIDSPMTLFLPAAYKKRRLPFSNPLLRVEWFNAVGAEGFEWLENLLFGAKLAMPRPRNVLIPSIMIGVWLGFKEIYVCGADHSWMQTISVNENNEVVTIQPHFYKEDSRESARVVSAYKGYRLHQIVHSFYVAFRSYFPIARFASKCGINIYNSTPGSFIDAFPRRPLP